MNAALQLSISTLARPRNVDNDAVALHHGETRISYRELEDRANRLAGALVAAGVKPDHRIAFIGRNSIECIEVLLGVSKVGAVPVFLNWRLNASELAPLILDCEPPLLFTDKEFAGIVDEAISELPRKPVLYITDAITGANAYCEWRDGHSAEDTSVVEVPGDTAVQLYTSGTTGRPKGAMLTRAGFSEALPDAVEFWGIDPSAVVLSVLPMYHIAGLGLAIGTLWAGGRLVISNDASAEATLLAIEEHGVTHLVLASMMLQALVSAPAYAHVNLSSLRTVSYGAAPISAGELRRVIERMDCRVVQPYGLTETCGVITLLDDDDHRQSAADPALAHRLASCGRVRPDVELRIVDPSTGKEVAAGECGEIHVRSARLMSGYWRLPEASADALIEGGWFRTGDVASVDSDGYVTLIDRLKDVIISGGENVYPQEIEAVLRDFPGIVDVAVVGKPHQKWGETPVAIVVAATGAEPDTRALIDFARARLAHYKCPGTVLCVEALPRNATGKVLRKALRDQLEG